jgi:hypothetical protein
MNKFIENLTIKDTYTEKGALSHSTSSNFALDYFANAGTYRDRLEGDVAASISRVWSEDPELALRIMFYLRMISRKTKGFFESESVQKGQGIKDEFIKLLKWLENSHPEVLYKNLWIVPIVGSWKDLWYDSASSGYYHYVTPKEVYKLVETGLADSYNRALIAKYLPRIRSKSNIKNDRHRRLNKWALGLCKHLGWSQMDYRKFKSNPENNAHLFQRFMCNNYWEQIDFKAIPGKALFNLVSRTGRDGKTSFQRHNVEEKYIKWLYTQPTVKFTGYVYDLFKSVNKKLHSIKIAEKVTYDKQFDGLIELAKADKTEGLNGNVFCALDTSGSMSSMVNENTSAYEVCISLGIYFSALNEGAFKDHVIMFDNDSRILKLAGTFTERVQQIQSENTAWGTTNFTSVIDLIVKIRKEHPNIPLEEYPETILVVSDLQFDPSGSNETNYETAVRKLKAVGINNVKFVWWQVTGRSKQVPNKFNDKGVTMISGFDGSSLSLILGGQQDTIDAVTGEKRQLNPYENMIKMLDQELLNMLKI